MAAGSRAAPRPPSPEQAGPGRPPSGARERILEAATAILKSDGYAGLTLAKVSSEAGENKALIGYHFGGKQGLVAAVARDVVAELLAAVGPAIEAAASVEELARGALAGVFVQVERDEGVQRIYFDLASQSIVDPEIETTMAEVKAAFREILRGRLRELAGLEDPAEIEAAAVLLIAGVEGLALERLDRGETPELAAARELWISAVASSLEP